MKCCKNCVFLCSKKYGKTKKITPYCNFYDRFLLKVDIDNDYCQTHREKQPHNVAVS